jgi:hypothetical protein
VKELPEPSITKHLRPWIIPILLAAVLIAGFVIGFLTRYRPVSPPKTDADIILSDELKTALHLPDLQMQLIVQEKATGKPVILAENIDSAQRYIRSLSLTGKSASLPKDLELAFFLPDSLKNRYDFFFVQINKAFIMHTKSPNNGVPFDYNGQTWSTQVGGQTTTYSCSMQRQPKLRFTIWK